MGARSIVPQGRGSKAGDINHGYSSLMDTARQGRDYLLSSTLPYHDATQAESLPDFRWPVCNLQRTQKFAHALQTAIKLGDRSGVGDADVVAGSKTLAWNRR